MTAPLDRALALLRLATNESTTDDERRTAAVKLAAHIATHGLLSASAGADTMIEGFADAIAQVKHNAAIEAERLRSENRALHKRLDDLERIAPERTHRSQECPGLWDDDSLPRRSPSSPRKDTSLDGFLDAILSGQTGAARR